MPGASENKEYIKNKAKQKNLIPPPAHVGYSAFDCYVYGLCVIWEVSVTKGLITPPIKLNKASLHVPPVMAHVLSRGPRLFAVPRKLEMSRRVAAHSPHSESQASKSKTNTADHLAETMSG